MTPLLIFDLCVSYLVFAFTYAVLTQVFEFWHQYRPRRIS